MLEHANWWVPKFENGYKTIDFFVFVFSKFWDPWLYITVGLWFFWESLLWILWTTLITTRSFSLFLIGTQHWLGVWTKFFFSKNEIEIEMILEVSFGKSKRKNTKNCQISRIDFQCVARNEEGWLKICISYLIYS